MNERPALSEPDDSSEQHPTPWRLLLLGLQHVLVMYAGTIAVPLIVGGALRLPKEHLAYLLNSDLFAAGLITIIQSLGLWRIGVRLPVMMGVTFASVGPMIAIGSNPELGLLGIYGAVISAGLFGIVLAPIMGRVIGLFPPVVTGTVISLIGLSLMGVGINWAAGGQPTVQQVADGVMRTVPNPAYGAPMNLAIAGLVLVIILLVTKFGRGILASAAVLCGLLVGTVVATLLGKVSYSGVAEAPYISVISPLHFGMPQFRLGPILAMCTVMLITLVESAGMFLALADLTGRKLTRDDLVRGLRADGLGAVIGGLFNAFPYTSFSQNIGLISVTGTRSRYVTATAGGLLIVLGLFPKLAQIVASIPQFVLGGAGVVMFGMVAVTGLRILMTVDFERHRHNLFVVAISLGFGLIPTLAPTFFSHAPRWADPITHSGIVLGTSMAVLLNLYFNGTAASARVGVPSDAPAYPE